MNKREQLKEMIKPIVLEVLNEAKIDPDFFKILKKAEGNSIDFVLDQLINIVKTGKYKIIIPHLKKAKMLVLTAPTIDKS